MLLFHLQQFLTSFVRRQVFQCCQVTAKIGLLAFVPLWPSSGRIGVSKQVEHWGLTFSDLSRNVRVTFRRFTESLPYGLPWAFPPYQLGGSGQYSFILRVKGHLGLAHLDESLPFVLPPPSLKRISLVKPAQQFTYRVASGQKSVEIIFIQPFAMKQFNLFIQNSRECQLHSVFGLIVLGNI